MLARRVLIIAVIAAAVASEAGCAGAGASPADEAATGAGTVEAFVGDERRLPPTVSGELLDGAAFDLASLRESVVVLNIWGSWCAPCRAEAPSLEAVYQATKNLGVAFVGVDVRDGRDAAAAFVAGFGLTYPSLFDPAGRFVLAFRDVPPNVVPATILLDRRHRVAAVFRKTVGRRELESAVQALATEEKP